MNFASISRIDWDDLGKSIIRVCLLPKKIRLLFISFCVYNLFTDVVILTDSILLR